MISPFLGVIALFITSRDPSCRAVHLLITCGCVLFVSFKLGFGLERLLGFLPPTVVPLLCKSTDPCFLPINDDSR